MTLSGSWNPLGKVYFTRSCFSSGRASGNRTIGYVKQTREAVLAFLQQEFIITVKFLAKNY